jgi:nucleoside-triphosphatase
MSTSPFRVGKYKIYLPGFEQFLKEIHLSEESTGLVMIDEIGKMECFSPLFRDSVLRLLDADQPFIATIGKKGNSVHGRNQEEIRCAAGRSDPPEP